ncbi:MAG: hypothetical protein IPN33_05695 [Saprospiraceae bacterium]|nr:hypothetical protein [Saprospiraceae bacterium]
MQLNYINKKTNEKVIEIDARYHDEKKSQLLKDQEEELAFEKIRRNWYLVLLTMAMFLPPCWFIIIPA